MASIHVRIHLFKLFTLHILSWLLFSGLGLLDDVRFGLNVVVKFGVGTTNGFSLLVMISVIETS